MVPSRFVHPVARLRGRCHANDHYGAGMKMVITVEP